MATPQLSPGVLVREIDLTVGRVDNVVNNIGAIAGPFQIGPINEPIEVSNQAELLETFGQPLSTDRQYEYWMSASSYLSYGGVLKVVRTDGSTLNNANAGAGVGTNTALKIENLDDYEENHSETTDYTWASKNPGSWGNGLKVCIIDNQADQTLGITTTGISASDNLNVTVGCAVTAAISGGEIAGAGSTSTFTGYIEGIVTGIATVTSAVHSIDVKVIKRVSSAGTVTEIDYQKGNALNSFTTDSTLSFFNSGISTAYSVSPTTENDWYDQQQLTLNTPIYWNTIAPRPVDSNFVSSRSGKNDGIHIVVVDDDGSVTGVQGNILEKHTFLSKALDTTKDGEAPTKTYYKNYLANNSKYIFAGKSPSSAADAFWDTTPTASGFRTARVTYTVAEGVWGQNAQSIVFSGIGNKTYTLTGGKDYSSTNGFEATLGELQTSYELFSNEEQEEIDFLIMGPGLGNRLQTQAKANQLISIAEQRKDCIAVIGPDRTEIVDKTDSDSLTNLLKYYSPLTSSSYAVFDTGWKYMYDRFNNGFVWIPCNADVAGTMVRTEIEAFPWFSPAGAQRGGINDAIKLAYNPSKSHRDQLYGQRINPIVNKRGVGIILFGDKTALSYNSAFDRLNVRRLFLTVEQALESVADAQLFEVNDEITRANFVNAVEPYLRDVQAKRGLYDFVVKCDENNNTPDIIDNNEFRADIFLKPTKSINYVTLTFVATRSGVEFEEVVGTV